MKLSVLNILFFVVVAASAQPLVRFSALNHQLGEVAWLMPRVVTFEFINAGDAPLKVLDVRADCDCTEATWPRTMIAKGESAQISVRFDATLLGTFSKSVAVYTNASEEPTFLSISGKVVREVSYRPEDYAHRIGDFHLNRKVMEFDNVGEGATPKVVLQIFNGSTRAFHPEFMHMPPYLSAVAIPDVINPGVAGELHVEVNSSLVKNEGLTRSTVYLSRYVGDRISPENALDVIVTKVPKLDDSPEALKLAPQVVLSDTIVDFGRFGKKTKLKGRVQIVNNGASALEIRRLQVYTQGVRASLNKSVVQPGEKATLQVQLSADALEGEQPRVLLITNDPRCPKQVIHLKAER